ncbi:hypothetical protein [Streptomyces sp. NBC_00102]|uniref:hypothetical protein n=1 Tax=Streptomyces sp. NBC_00102 TaxID=2975652 RepID=UPI0022514651|nr:hypothetical protein [Streptomyces sp. NBC_00102]MCX5397797.1 hypothetical protein [Streptomyces sp. NBC_00102]
MGIESDQLVYEFLSRVGDLAQRQQLSSAARMRLVGQVREEIEKQRGRAGADSPAAVRRIIGRLGEPGELVAAAVESAGAGEPAPPSAPLPPPRSAPVASETAHGPGDAPAGPVPAPRRGVFRPRPDAGEPGGQPGGSGGPDEERREEGSRWGASPFRKNRGGGRGTRKTDGAEAAHEQAGTVGPSGVDWAAETGDGGYWPDPSAPHVLGLDRQGDTVGEREWWRVEPGPFGEFGDGVRVPGFVGGVEIPALLKPPPRPREDDEDDEDGDADGTADPDAADEAPGEAAAAAPGSVRRRLLPLPRLLRRRPAPAPAEPAAAAPAGRRGLGSPLLLLAAALLVAGAVIGSWLALVGGWALAYTSRTLSRAEAKWAALGLPGVVAAGTVLWVWGRMRGRWGEPIAEGTMGDVLTGLWPGALRTAAVASAVYLVWRARRARG